jgi:hypothetical protein
MTCRLQEVRPHARCALPAQMSRVIALRGTRCAGIIWHAGPRTGPRPRPYVPWSLLKSGSVRISSRSASKASRASVAICPHVTPQSRAGKATPSSPAALSARSRALLCCCALRIRVSFSRTSIAFCPRATFSGGSTSGNRSWRVCSGLSPGDFRLGGTTELRTSAWELVRELNRSRQGVLLDRSHNDPGQEEGNLAEGKAASLTLSQLES